MAAETRRRREPMIDCDVHNALPSDDALQPYMPEEWRERRDALGYLPLAFRQVRENLGDRSYMGAEYPRPTPRASRVDAWPPGGGLPASDLAFTQAQLLDAWDVETAVLNPLLGIGEMLNLELGSVLATAANDWLAAEWLDPEPPLPRLHRRRLRGRDRRRGGDRPDGRRQAVRPGAGAVAHHRAPGARALLADLRGGGERHGLPLGIHNGGWGGHPMTPAGFPSYYIEDTAAMALAYQAQVTSLLVEGVLTRFPGLRVVLIEGGFAWLPALMLAPRPGVAPAAEPRRRCSTAPPSELIRERIYVSTQPMEETERPEHFPELLEQLGMDDRIMFSTDYPHWDFDAPDMALPVRLPADLRRKILHDNAARLYGLGVPAAAGG